MAGSLFVFLVNHNVPYSQIYITAYCVTIQNANSLVLQSGIVIEVG